MGLANNYNHFLGLIPENIFPFRDTITIESDETIHDNLRFVVNHMLLL